MRDTWEVPLERVAIDRKWWDRTLLPVLDELRADLGLPEGSRLTAELHSMLVYAPGQFFRPHQDSEKADEMVGTLVVTLPSPYTGGALVVEHRGERVTYRASRSTKKPLSFVAFYADCLTFEFLRAGNSEDLVPCVVGALRQAAAEDGSPGLWTAAGYDALAEHSAQVLETRLAEPVRAPDDWSIPLPDGCNCELCQELGAFLADPARREIEWPLNKERRKHVHRRLDRHQLPVRHTTRRTGRPYVLVLTKTDALFEREAVERRRLEEDLARLQGAGLSNAARRTPSRTRSSST